ncbi:DUF3429 domain-containing protein [Vreelandella rituensis]|uniref:DUF3429 domain-containing protein n=1 Tax=Vreelandella rituensis TaxID=2282306 RepID=A0A368U6R9_9GAMM|nr:DUF3429 domain-containing protein [Halomonas rituensis]RCV92644.1 DUF3429 domain-containing protein [Halomonas rituensis]
MAKMIDDRRVVWLLGLAGLIPFIVTGVLAWTAPSSWQLIAVYAFLYYSAVILSFLGGVQWGMALSHHIDERASISRRLALAMVPSLIAWPALLLNLSTGAWVLAIGFILIWAYDASREGRAGFPGWYLPLRSLLSVVVILTHLLVIWRLKYLSG